MPTARFWAIFWATAVLVSPQAPPASTLTPAEITQAIADGTAGKRLQAACNAVEPGETLLQTTELRVAAEGPMGRIMRAAEFAAQVEHHPLTPADISPELSAPTVLVSATIFAPASPSTASRRLPTFVVTMDGAPVPGMSLPKMALPPVFPESRVGEQRMLFDLRIVQAKPDADLQISGTESSGRRTWKCSISASEKMKLK